MTVAILQAKTFLL